MINGVILILILLIFRSLMAMSLNAPLMEYIRGVFRNNVHFFNNFTLLSSMEIKIIFICFCIFLSSFRRVWLSSDDFAQSYGLSKRGTIMNPGHVKVVHDVNEVALL